MHPVVSSARREKETLFRPSSLYWCLEYNAFPIGSSSSAFIFASNWAILTMCLATVPYTQKHQKSRGLAPLHGGEGQQRTQRGCSAAGCSNHCSWAVCSWEGSSPPRGITLKACLKGRLGSRSENMLNSLCEAEDQKGKKKKGPCTKTVGGDVWVTEGQLLYSIGLCHIATSLRGEKSKFLTITAWTTPFSLSRHIMHSK